jgi:ESCRT-I complex subunit TSG101
MYHGATYNIPITIYFDPPYPNVPPRIFVTPTNDMIIKPNHRCVDGNGRVYLPQLSQWNAYRSSLVEVVGILSSTFSAEPPVNSVAAARPRPSTVVAQSNPVAAIVSRPVTVVPNRRDQLVKSITIKLRAKLPARIKTEIDAINDARRREAKNVSTQKEIREFSGELAATRKACLTKKLELERLILEANQWLSEHRGTTKRSPDEASEDGEYQSGVSDNEEEGGHASIAYLDAESVVGQQVIDLMAEECAIEDLIDLLNERNRAGKLSMSDLLREVRSLTRRLFEIKFIKQRCLIVVKTRKPLR